MKKLLWIIIILSIFTSANIAQAQSALPATSVRTSDGSNVQLKLNALSSSAASNTAEIEAINQNLTTHEAELAAITAEINLMNVNLGTIETRIDSIESNILSMIEPAITELRLNLGTIEDLINSNYNSLFANLGTHENELNDIKSNLATHETSLLALQTNDGTQETRIESNEVGIQSHLIDEIGAHAGSAISYTDTYSIGAVELQAAIDTVTVWLNSVDLRLESLETNIISLIQPAIDIITANLDTHETAITALITNDQTQEVRLVRATASYENRYKKMILQYGYPIAINDLWDVNKAAAVYAMYDIVVIGDEYEKTAHEAHADTVLIIERLKELKTDVEVFGYVAIGGELGANLDTAEIQLRIDEWLATGATGIFLDEFGYDYLVTRERQNMAVDYAHSKGMNVIANSWNIDWVFNNDDGYIEWEEFYGNPNLVAPSINSNDYYLFENLFYYYESGQKASDQWRIYEVYRYYYDSATSTWGKNYYDQFGTKTLGLDGIQSTNANKDLYFINAYVGGRIINLDGYGASIELWGSSSTAYNHYNPSFFNNEASMFHRDKIQPTVSDYAGATYAQYDTKINGVTAKLIWKPGATASNPTLGTHKVQINGVDRTKTYVSSSATNTNAASTLVARDASGNFSAGTITAALAGNASTATKLAIPKNIAGTAFDGSLDIDISHNNLINIGLRSHDDIDAAFNTIEIELSSISVAINNLDLRLGAIELILAGGSSGEVLTKTDDSFTWATIPSGVTDHTLLSNIGTKTHLELEQDILDLQANPAGISRVYIDGVALPTGEVEFVSGDNVTLNVSGSTVEVVATGGGGAVATVEITLNQDYTARAQGTAEAGFYSIYDFPVKYNDIVAGTIQPTVNGLSQYETDNFIVGTWDDSGTNRLRITFTSDVAADALVRVSCFTTLPLLAVISANNVSTNDGWLQDGLDAIWIAINDRYTKAETNATIEAAIAAIPTSTGATAIEDIGTFISANVFEFSTDYSTTEVMIFRNGIYQPRRLFTTADVVGKTRVYFASSINDSDEILLISLTGE